MLTLYTLTCPIAAMLRIFILLALLLGVILLYPPDSQAHRSGCHRWHSCPSDRGTYTCGDIGYCSACPDNQYCEGRRPRTARSSIKPAPLVKPSPSTPPPTPVSGAGFRNVTWIRCYDGDTCTFTLPGVHPFFGEKISVRLRGIDTPEIRGKCEAEKQKAKAARDFLRSLLRKASRIDLVDAERGKYFRIVATVQADGRNVAAQMIERDLGRPYQGGKRKGWC